MLSFLTQILDMKPNKGHYETTIGYNSWYDSLSKNEKLFDFQSF